MPLTTPVAYQGGKTRLAAQIVDAWWPTNRPFYDLCCGGGAVSIEMLNRGASPEDVIMVDKGPWGLFWSEIGAGTFNFDIFVSYLDAIPKDLSLVRGFMQELASYPASNDTSEVFIILQASSFGGKALWIENNKWMNTSFRDYWLPTATSNRRSPVNPMMPMPETLSRRVYDLMCGMLGVQGWWADARDFVVEPDSLVYIDPPYMGTTAYGHTLDAEMLFQRVSEHSMCYISEGRPLSEQAVRLSSGRSKGGVSGARANANQEWLSSNHCLGVETVATLF